MRILFYLGIIGLIVFEFLKVYFIMPLPGSQQWASLDFAFALHQNRWLIRASLILLVLFGLRSSFDVTRKWIPLLSIILTGLGVVLLNFKMSADAMFREPNHVNFLSKKDFKGGDSTLVVVIGDEVEAKAYPVRYLVFHHQVRDQLKGNEVMVTYCSVCRTGRVYLPKVNGEPEKFRLVGMDYFNAMFEDSRTGSWWQQATGKAIAGPLKGQKLEEIEMLQMSASSFFRSFPQGKIMDADPDFISSYDTLGKYELGKSESKLTGTDPFSWNEKSWVVGINHEGDSKAYDWNELKEAKAIRDSLGKKEIIILLHQDFQSFIAFELPAGTKEFRWTGETLFLDSAAFSFVGKSETGEFPDLIRIKAYQEFWHSWNSFQPKTQKFSIE